MKLLHKIIILFIVFFAVSALERPLNVSAKVSNQTKLDESYKINSHEKTKDKCLNFNESNSHINFLDAHESNEDNAEDLKEPKHKKSNLKKKSKLKHLSKRIKGLMTNQMTKSHQFFSALKTQLDRLNDSHSPIILFVDWSIFENMDELTNKDMWSGNLCSFNFNNYNEKGILQSNVDVFVLYKNSIETESSKTKIKLRRRVIVRNETLF